MTGFGSRAHETKGYRGTESVPRGVSEESSMREKKLFQSVVHDKKLV